MTFLSVNRRAYYDYQILQEFEAGIALLGFEVKAIKTGRINLSGSYVVFKDDEPWLLNATIPPYQEANTPKNYDPQRSRRLLLHKSEIKDLRGKLTQKGLTILPLKVYNKKRKVKLLIGLARNKREYDKREIIKKREDERMINRAMRT